MVVFRKIPLLVELGEPEPAQFNWYNLFSKTQNSFKNLSFFKGFSFEIFLQKILSKIRILTLKTEKQISFWLQKLRERSQKKKFGENDNYWKEIKKIKKGDEK